MLKAAVIGVGSMGKHHARIYREMDLVELVGIVDQNATTAAQVAARNAVPYFLSLDELLDKHRPDLVSLAVPTSFHYSLAMQLIDQGIHVLIEKPIATTVEEGERLIDAAERAGVVVAVGHIERFNPAVMELERQLRDGKLGNIYQIHTQRLSPYPPRIQDSGVLLDLGSHDIDLIRCLINDEVLSVYAETMNLTASKYEDTFNGLMRFRGGAVGVLDVNWMTPTKIRRLTITGRRGMFVCNLLAQELVFYENGEQTSEWETLSLMHGVSEGNTLGIRIARQEPLMTELTDFVQAVDDGRLPTVTARSATETLRLILDFLQSSAKHTVIQREMMPT